MTLIGQDKDLFQRPRARNLVASVPRAHESERVNRALRLLTAVTRAARRATDIAALRAEICDIVIGVGGYCLAWIGGADDGPDRRVLPLARAGKDVAYLDRVVVTWDEAPTGQGPVGTAIRTGEAVVIRDLLSDPRFAPWRAPALDHGFRSVAAFPLSLDGQVRGAMALYSASTDAFHPEECSLLADLADEVSFAINALRAATSRQEAETALRRSEASLARAQRIANVGSWEWDLRSNKVVWSDQTFNLFGLDPADVEPSQDLLLAFAHPEDRPELARLLEQIRCSQVSAARMTFRVWHEDQSIRWLQMLAELEFHDCGPDRIVGVLQDITERVRFEQRLEQLATHDALTGLPNRYLLSDRIEQALAHARHSSRMVAVAFVDLDRFKIVNDSLGHNAGDQLLKEVAARLVSCLREGDTVARQGGDEFVVVMTGLAKPEDASLVSQKMLEALAPPVIIAGQEVSPEASIGIAVYPRDGRTQQTLMMNADKAMYGAKQAGRNQYRFYDTEMNRAAAVWLEVGASLNRALERSEFVLHYQPKVDFRSGAITGVEALLRWHSQVLGMVSPAKFIPLLEESSRIIQVGEWVLAEACRQGRRWLEQGLPALRIAVNLSPRQFQQHDLAARVRKILDETRFPAANLELEITESMVAHNVERAISLLDELRAMGLHLSIDDFGTGYSSLNSLKRFPVSCLKIDRSFVEDVPNDPDDVAITRAVILLGHSMGLSVVAEGVETEAQRRFLFDAGCDAMQGFLLARPMPADDLADFVTRSFAQEAA
jgi:diguanylate cyclase (GGDEF)-like protein/PAS domain S-box-containing protein